MGILCVRVHSHLIQATCQVKYATTLVYGVAAINRHPRILINIANDQSPAWSDWSQLMVLEAGIHFLFFCRLTTHHHKHRGRSRGPSQISAVVLFSVSSLFQTQDGSSCACNTG